MQLKIYIAEHCWGCAEARSIAAQVDQLYPQLTVEVIDVDREDVKMPDEVFVTPTYMLNGRVVSLGNPKPERLRELIDTELRPPA